MTNLPFGSHSHDYVRDLASMSDHDFFEYAKEIAHSNTTPPTTTEKYLVCKAGKGRFILSYSDLREVTLPPRHYTYLPSSPSWMPGLVAWQNEVIASVDFSAYSSQSSSSERPTNMLVVSHNNMTIGLLLHVVDSIANLTSGPLPSPQTQTLPEAYTTFPCQDAIVRIYPNALVLAIPPLFTHLLHSIKGTLS
jgi:chemotaxis signal transduction protein